jgi:hypothetical protein
MSDAPQDMPPGYGKYFGPNWYGEQDENGIDLSLIRENLKLTPLERIRKADRARRQALRLQEYGRRYREERLRGDR